MDSVESSGGASPLHPLLQRAQPAEQQHGGWDRLPRPAASPAGGGGVVSGLELGGRRSGSPG
jgi:hypothetical protein